MAGAAVDADGALAPGTLEQETERAWRNVVPVADTAGYSVEEILYVQCVLADRGAYSALNDLVVPPVSRHRPPRRDNHSGWSPTVRREDRVAGDRRALSLIAGCGSRVAIGSRVRGRVGFGLSVGGCGLWVVGCGSR